MNSDLLYTAQFEFLRVWLNSLDSEDLDVPSVLNGWSVRDLVAHLAGTGESIAALEPLPPEEQRKSALSVAEYVSAYAGSAEEIGQMARDINARADGNVLSALDGSHQRAVARLDALGGSDVVVRARRGPILLSSFLDTRVLELVVHTGDLARSLPQYRAPRVLSAARTRAVQLLREVLTARADDPVPALEAASVLDQAVFVDIATGRAELPTEIPPELAKVLPLL